MSEFKRLSEEEINALNSPQESDETIGRAIYALIELTSNFKVVAVSLSREIHDWLKKKSLESNESKMYGKGGVVRKIVMEYYEIHKND
jgi:hypothetical protein